MTQTAKTHRLPFSTPFFYGWLLVFVAALTYFFSGPGQTHTVSVFIDSYITEFGWSRSFVSFMYSLGTLAAGFVLVYVGRLLDRCGHRLMITATSLLFAAALIWMSLISAPWMLFFGFFAIRLLGQGSMGLYAGTLPALWFETKRGRATSFMALGGAIGAGLMPPLTAWLIESQGWSWSWRFWAAGLVLVMAPMAWLLVRNRPESVGMRPDGIDASGSGKTKDGCEVRSWTLAQACRTRTFYLFLFCQFVPSMVNTGMVFHMISILRQQRIEPVQAAAVLGLIAAVALPTTFVAGMILDKYPAHKVVGWTNVGQVLIMLWLIYTRSYPMALVFGVIRGIVQGFESMNFNVVWPNYFGRRHLGSIRGVAMTLAVLGSAFGPLPLGFAFDQFGGYSEILWIMLVFPILSVAAAFAARPPQWGERL